MKLSPVVTWTSLCLNAVLLVFLLLMFLVCPYWLARTPPMRALPSEVAALGMEVYYEKDPFVLLVGKDFPRDKSFVLVQRDQPLSISALDTERLGGKVGTTAKTLTVGLGDDFSLSCDYSLAGGGTNAEHLMLCRRDQGLLEALTDYNVDGVFDVRQTRDEKQQGN